MKATVDKATCLGCGLCVDVCPDVFEMDADNTAVVRVDAVPSESEDSVRDAQEQCPESSIKVEQDE